MASALSAPKISLPIADHNAPLVGDTLSTVALNYQWRRVLVHLAEDMLDRRIYDGTEAEIDTAIQQVHALISDMYTFEDSMVYHGAHVGRTTDQLINTIPNVVIFDDVTTPPLHDTAGFFDPAFPYRLKIPVGFAGWYHCFGFLQLANGVLWPYTWLKIFGAEELDRAFTAETEYNQIRMFGTRFMGEGDSLELRVVMTTGTRLLKALSAFHPYSARLGLYRIGDAP